MVIKGRGFYIALTYSKNSSPLNVTLEHQLRIVVSGRAIDVSNFTVIDDGTIQPRRFRIYAKLPNGYMNLTGKVISYWPAVWPRSRGTWWNPRGTVSWGRAFTEWSGEVVINGVKHSLRAVGVGEYTRYVPKPLATTTCSEACWVGQTFFHMKSQSLKY